MANQVSFGQFVDPEQQAIERQRMLAQQLREQSQAPLETTFAGGMAVPVSKFAGVAKLIQALGSKKLEGDADAKQVAYQESAKARNGAEIQAFVNALRGTPATPETQGNNPSAYTPAQAETPGDPNQAMLLALQSRNPALQQAGGSILKDQITPQKPMVVGRSLVDPKTGKVVGVDQTWQAEQDAAREAKKAELQAKRDDARASHEERLAAQKELQQMQLQGRADMLRLAASLRPAPQPVQPQIVTTPEGIFQVDRGGNTVPLKAPDGKPLSGKQAAPAKALPTPTAKALGEQAEIADSTQRFAAGFKPEYGGKTITGDLSNTAKRIFGDDTGQAQWWQDYQMHKNAVRNKMFGSALTEQEKSEWEKSDISPRMNPEQINKNLQRRAMLENKALDRLIRSNTAAGYNKDQIKELTGRDPDMQPTSPAPAGGFKIIGVK